jgi:hypothetical protein
MNQRENFIRNADVLAQSYFQSLSFARKLGVLGAELLTLLGQFLPIKSILIIHSQAVPAFLEPYLGGDFHSASIALFLSGGVMFVSGRWMQKRLGSDSAPKGNHWLSPVAVGLAMFLAPLVPLFSIAFGFMAWFFFWTITPSSPSDRASSSRKTLRFLTEFSMLITATGAFCAALVGSNWAGTLGVLASAVLVNRAHRELRPLFISLRPIFEARRR